jgi:hypothetical protein
MLPEGLCRPYQDTPLDVTAVRPHTSRSRQQDEERSMTLCPIAIVAGCQKCPAFSVCPLKSVIGDQPKEGQPKSPADAANTGKKP